MHPDPVLFADVGYSINGIDAGCGGRPDRWDHADRNEAVFNVFLYRVGKVVRDHFESLVTRDLAQAVET